ncbi:MAG: hypothetical protein Rsou_0538 [Candidatus Ruthia sp. Asou_11_S2]|nr:hypothetical protein [Candidatus Ruthia sp. Asou_11_S2]
MSAYSRQTLTLKKLLSTFYHYINQYSDIKSKDNILKTLQFY